ncbi:MAG: ABC transporter substrate-binding protein [Candidatus Spechtbacterales bacterium]
MEGYPYYDLDPFHPKTPRTSRFRRFVRRVNGLNPVRYLKRLPWRAVFSLFTASSFLVRAVVSGSVRRVQTGRMAIGSAAAARSLPGMDAMQDRYGSLTFQERIAIAILAIVLVISLVALLAHLALVITGNRPGEGGQYREAIVGSPQFVNPVLALRDTDRTLATLIFPSLMRYEKDGTIVPDLAETYEIVDEGRTYRFKLRQDAVWQDGTPITANDVLFTIERIQNSDYRSPQGTRWQGVQISTEGDDRVIFRLTSAYSPFLERTTMGILPQHVWQDVAADNFPFHPKNIEPIGGGMFVFDELKRNEQGAITSYTLKRNTRYHNQRPHLERLTFLVYPHEDAAIAAYHAHEIDGIAGLSAPGLATVKRNGSSLHAFSIPRYFALFFNPERSSILQDQAVRRALLRATDRQGIIDEILHGNARRIDTPISPTLKNYYNTDVQPTLYDLDGARQILEGAGWTDTNDDGVRQKAGTPLAATLVTVSVPELLAVAERVAAQWSAVGVQVNIQAVEPARIQQDSIRPHAYDILLYGLIVEPIPDPYPFWHSSQAGENGFNLALYKNRTVDALLDEARTETDESVRIEKYKEFQRIVAEDIPAIFLYDPTYVYVMRNNVRGVSPAMIAEPAFRFVDVRNWFMNPKGLF